MGEKNATDLLTKFKTEYPLGKVLYGSGNNTLSELVKDDRKTIKKLSDELVGKMKQLAKHFKTAVRVGPSKIFCCYKCTRVGVG